MFNIVSAMVQAGAEWYETRFLVPAGKQVSIVLDLPERGLSDPLVVLGCSPVVPFSIACPAIGSGWISPDEFSARVRGSAIRGKVDVWVKNEGDADTSIDLRLLGIPVKAYDAYDREATARWYASNAWRGLRWAGVPALKCPFDLWVVQEILFSLKPDVVVETGTFCGGSAAFYATVLDVIGTGRVITIDVDPRGCVEHPRIEYVVGSSVDPEVLKRVREACTGRTVMVSLDSDHSKDHVLAELRAYSPFVSPGSYLVAEDTNCPGPAEAVAEFLASAEGVFFSPDRECERLGITCYPGGWLRRDHDARGS